MADIKMHVCLEATDDQGEPVYVIYSAKLSDLLDDKSVVKIVMSVSPPHFTMEAVITGGVRSMGCGVFQSKIVLAGGSVKGQDGEDEKYKGVITYDTNTKQVSREDVAVMRGGKVRPLLFQLDNKLYALDTSRYRHTRSYEVYYPNQKHWHQLDLYQINNYCLDRFAESKGISFFSWFVFGHCFCISLPKDTSTFLHHARSLFKTFRPRYKQPLPFPGMAITYCTHGFEDVVLISFSKDGLVEGRRLRVQPTDHAKPVLIFDTKTYSHHHGDLTGCFADFGYGIFSLTTFDNVDIYVHMFKISRCKSRNDDDLNLRLLKRSMHRYKYTDFSEAGHTSFTFAGCFAPSPAGWSKESTEVKLYSSRFPQFDKREDDDIPCTKCEHFSDTDDVEDSMDHEMGTVVVNSDTGSD